MKTWTPKNGDTYFSVLASGLVLEDMYNDIIPGHKEKAAFGNCFRTREEALKALERVRAALKRTQK